MNKSAWVILLFAFGTQAHSLKLTQFTKSVATCLRSKNVACLQKKITVELSFPEHLTFGCQTEKAGKITPYEFALCAMKSKVKCTDFRPKIKAKTLFEALSDCFLDMKSVGSTDQIITRSGYVCRLEDVNHELFISSVAIQDHLSGFEETVDEQDQRLRKDTDVKDE